METKPQAMQPISEAGNFLNYYVHDLQRQLQEKNGQVASLTNELQREKSARFEDRSKILQLENKLHLKDQEMALELRGKEVEEMKGLGAVVDYVKSQEGTQLIIELVKIMNGSKTDISEDVKAFAQWYSTLNDNETKLVDRLIETVASSNIEVVVPKILNLFTLKRNQENNAPKTQYQEAI